MRITIFRQIKHHWMHDAVLFKSESSSVATGLIGIPMQYIKLYLAKDSP